MTSKQKAYICCMKYLLLSLLVIIFSACGNEAGYKKATDAQDAGREFIRASLDGDMKKAGYYLSRDSANIYIFNKFRDQYNQLSAEEKKQYREAQIRPIKIEKLDDSTYNYIYSNSYKQKDTTVIKIIKENGEWLVDLKELRSKE